MSREAPTFKDYYEVLHLHPEADAAMVDQAYWHLARLYNAAIPTDSGARSMLEELNEAYSVLRTPELRDEYDSLRDAVLGVGALPEPRETAGEPPPLSVMQKQKTRARDTDAVDESAAVEQPAKERSMPKLRLNLDLKQVVVPKWQGAVVLVCFIVLAGSAITAGAEPALVLATLIVGAGFTVIPILSRAPKMLGLPRPQVVLPAIGPPNLSERLPRQNVNTDKLRVSTEAMLARWRENTGQAQSPDIATFEPPLAVAEPPPPRQDPLTVAQSDGVDIDAEQQSNGVDTERLRQSLRKSTEAIRARMRETGDSDEQPS